MKTVGVYKTAANDTHQEAPAFVLSEDIRSIQDSGQRHTPRGTILCVIKGLLLGEYKVLGLKSPQHSEKESIIRFINRALAL